MFGLCITCHVLIRNTPFYAPPILLMFSHFGLIIIRIYRYVRFFFQVVIFTIFVFRAKYSFLFVFSTFLIRKCVGILLLYHIVYFPYSDNYAISVIASRFTNGLKFLLLLLYFMCLDLYIRF